MPGRVALKRLRHRPAQAAALAVALAGAAAFAGVGGLVGALAAEDYVQLRLARAPAADRSFVVAGRVDAGEREAGAARATARALAGLSPWTTAAEQVRLWDPVAPADERGVRLVRVGRPAADVVVSTGRLPRVCTSTRCEVLALGGAARLGERVRLGPAVAVVVGRGTLEPALLPAAYRVSGRSLLVPSGRGPLDSLLRRTGRTVVTTAPLRPAAVRAASLGSLATRFREEAARLERAEPGVQVTAPIGLLHELDDRIHVARRRLLLVAAQSAALILAFAALVVAAGRATTRRSDQQLRTLGASRAQRLLVRTCEAALLAIAGAGLASAGIVAAGEIIRRRRHLPGSFLASAIGVEGVVAIAALCAAGAAVLVLASRSSARGRSRSVGFELAAVAALAVLVWQAWQTGALDPSTIAAQSNPSPVLLLLPGLVFAVAAAVLLRLLPPLFLFAERGSRKLAFGARLALVDTARHPAQTAATVAFLTVALGSALFGLDYRATLADQTRDAASFAAGAPARVVESGPFGSHNVTPLTRYRSLHATPTPVLRLDGSIAEAGSSGAPRDAEVLALPAARLRDLHGWRSDFSRSSRATLAARLASADLRLAGAPIPAPTSELGIWARGKTETPREVELDLLQPGTRFVRLRLGSVGRRWRLLRAPLPRTREASRLVAVELLPTASSPAIEVLDEGVVDLGPLEGRVHGRWRELSSFGSWTAAEAPGRTGFVNGETFRSGPRAAGVRFALGGTTVPLMRPDVTAPPAIPAVVGPDVARDAVDNRLTVTILDQPIPVQVVGVAKLFPTVTDMPSRFVVLDYADLFTLLNRDRPGVALPTEAWLFSRPPPGFAEKLAQSPFRLEQLVDEAQLRKTLTNDPLARGVGAVLLAGAIVAAALACLGLVLSAQLRLRSEQAVVAEYEALGIAPATVDRSIQYGVILLTLLGAAGGLAGALLAVRFTAALVAVSAGSGVALPSLEAQIPWPQVLGLLLVCAAVTIVAGWIVLRRDRFRPAAARMRA